MENFIKILNSVHNSSKIIAMSLGSVYYIDVTFPSNIWILNKMSIMLLLALHIECSFNFIQQNS